MGDGRGGQGIPARGPQGEGAEVLSGRGQEEPGPHVRPCQQAAGQDQDLQEANRGGRGDRRPQPGQVPQGSAGAGGDRGPCQDGRDCSPRLSLSLNTPRISRFGYEPASWTINAVLSTYFLCFMNLLPSLS